MILLILIEKIANKLPGWKAPLLSLAGRAVLVRFVITAIPIYLLIAIRVPKWTKSGGVFCGKEGKKSMGAAA